MIDATSEMRSAVLKKGIWFLIAALFVITIAKFIVEIQWSYLLLCIAPLLIYLLIKETIIFPFGLYLILLPFDSLLAMSSSGQGATITKALGILIIVALLLRGAFEKKLKLKGAEPATIWLLVFITYSIASSLWAIRSENLLSGIQSVIGLCLLYLTASVYQFKREDFNKLKWCILLGGLVAAAMTSYFFFSEQFFSGFGSRATVFYEDRGAINPNELAFCLLFPLCVSIEMLLSKKSRKMGKWFLSGVFIILLFSIIITGSRKNMLAVGVILLTFVSFFKEKRALALAIFIIASIVIYPLLPDIIFDRWGDAVESGGDGRIGIWTVGIKSLEKYWLYGAGLFNFPEVYTEFAKYNPTYMGLYRDSHNTFLEIIVELGIIGLFLMMAMLWKHYKAIEFASFRNDGNQVMLKAVFLAMMLANYFGDFFFAEKYFWIMLTMILIYRNILRAEMQKSFYGNREEVR